RSVEQREPDRIPRRPGFFAKLLDVPVDGATHRVLPRDAQLHPVNEKALHVDFMRVGARTRIAVGIPVHFINQDKSVGLKRGGILDRKSTRLNSSHGSISYAVFCLKKKKE